MAKKKKEAKPKPKEIKLSFDQLLAMYQQQQYLLESLVSQEKLINNLIKEVQAAQDALHEIRSAEKDASLLVPLGSGVFAYTTLADNSAVKVDIGGNVFERMPISKAIEKLEDRKANLRRNLKEVAQKKQRTLASVSQLERIIVEARKKMRETKAQGVA
ncbi:MAG: prefoldin subunit alpha [Candidatus Diapherotrites archaeon]|nr:prefoldin subunit alpha [Candidatus Diapherotrites archaeon]